MKQRIFVFSAKELPETAYAFNPWSTLTADFECASYYAQIPSASSDWGKLLRVTLQAFPLIWKMRSYDVVISTSIVNSFLYALMQRTFGKSFFKARHIVIDVGSTKRFYNSGIAVRSLLGWLFSPVDSMLCYASSSVNFWKNSIGLKADCLFIPVPAVGSLIELHPRSSNEGTYCFSAGRYGRDYTLLLEAIKGIDIPLIIVTETAQCRSLKKKADQNPRVQLFCELPFEKYAELLHKARFVVVPLSSTAYHTGQTVVVQAMTLGKAVVTSRTSGTMDYICDNEDGIFVEAGNVKALQDKIRFLVENPEEIARIGARARGKASTEFSDEAFGKRMKAIINRVEND